MYQKIESFIQGSLLFINLNTYYLTLLLYILHVWLTTRNYTVRMAVIIIASVIIKAEKNNFTLFKYVRD